MSKWPTVRDSVLLPAVARMVLVLVGAIAEAVTGLLGTAAQAAGL